MVYFSHRSALRLLSVVTFAMLSGSMHAAPDNAASLSDVSKLLIDAPYPKMPPVAMVENAHGDGVFVLRVNVKSGLVAEVIRMKSTRWADMDREAEIAFKQWRFKPGALPSTTQFAKLPPAKRIQTTDNYSLVKVPVTFGRESWRRWPMH